MECLDVMDIKQQNKKSIVNVLKEIDGKSGLTKRDIAAQTGLSFATVSNLCNELLEEKIVEAVKKDATAVGRTPFSVSLAYNRFRTICLNLQMKSVLRLAVMNLQNEMLYHRDYDIAAMESAEAVVQFAGEKFKEYRKEETETCEYIGVGVAVSGIFDLETETLINCAVKLYDGVRMKELVEREFGLPGYVDNESNLCALSLKHRIKNCKDLIYLHFSEGVGVGIVCNGSLVRGHHGYGGEVSYIPIGDPSRYCAECDAYGCIENDLSIPGIVQNYFDNPQENVLESWEEFRQDLEDGKEKAVMLSEKIAAYLGELAVLLICLLDPEYVYIGGELAEIYDLLYDGMYEVVRKKCFIYGKRKVQIVKDLQSDMTIHIGINELIYSRWKV